MDDTWGWDQGDGSETPATSENRHFWAMFHSRGNSPLHSRGPRPVKKINGG